MQPRRLKVCSTIISRYLLAMLNNKPVRGEGAVELLEALQAQGKEQEFPKWEARKFEAPHEMANQTDFIHFGEQFRMNTLAQAIKINGMDKIEETAAEIHSKRALFIPLDVAQKARGWY